MTNTVFDQLIAAWQTPNIRKHVGAAGIMLTALDRDGNIQFLNHSGCEVLEYDDGELLGKNWFDVCLPADERERLRPLFRNLLTDVREPVERLECRLLTRSGRERIVVCFNTVLVDKDGVRVGLFGSGKDITDHKHIEESLRESEELARAIVETSPDAIALIDLQGRFLKANRRMAALTGVESQEALLASGKNCLDFLSPEERDRGRQRIREVLESGGVSHGEYCAIRQDGAQFPVDIRGSLMKDSYGNPRGVTIVARDITERRLVEDALRKSEEKFSHLFNVSPAPTSVSRLPDGRILDCNEALLRLFGMSRQELVGSSTVDRWADLKDRERLLRILAAEGSVRDWECRLRRKDGHLLITRLCAEIVELDGEKCILALFVDVTERHRHEEEIQKLALVVRHATDLVSLTDLDGRMIFLNEAGSRLLGIPQEDVRQHKIGDVIPTEFLPLARNEVLPALRRRGKWEGEAQCLHVQTGARIDVQVMSFTVHDPRSGKPLYYANILRDITECKRAQQALQASEAKFRMLFESANDAIMLLSSEAFFDCNPRTLQMFGYASKEEFVGLHPGEVSPPFQPDGQDSLQAAREHIRSAFQQGSERFEWVHRKADGRDFPAEVILSVFEHCGRRILHATVRDVAERKKSQELLQQAKEAAEAASRAKSEFLANMSHEIRTPLTAILGYADVLLEHAATADTRDAADTIKRNGEHLLQIISDILDISKIEAAKLKPELSRCSPRQIVEEVASLMRVRADGKGLRLDVKHEGAIPETIRTDPVRLRQILINLVGNAIKFTEVGGVRVVSRLLDDDECQPRMRFDVIDTGIGLAEKQIGLLFQPFSQIDSSMQRKFGGSGLGLAISKRLAEMLGGTITVTSTLGEGSTFSVTVATGPLDWSQDAAPPPAFAQSPRPAADQPPLDRPLRNSRLLLAEDGPDNQRLISLVLRKAGAEVTVADNGQAAVDLALAAQREENPFDVILMDMQMPVLDGYKATAHLRAAGLTAPMIALTAHAMTEDRQKCLRAGCDDYMSKPIVARELVGLVASHLKHSENRTTDSR